jgi:hypothetical protein
MHATTGQRREATGSIAGKMSAQRKQSSRAAACCATRNLDLISRGNSASRSRS